MRQIRIISKTEIGGKALRTHYEESMKARWVVKQMLKKTGFNQELCTEKPITLTIWATIGSMFSLAKIPHIKEEIDAAMKLNDAYPDIDYYYEVNE